MKIEDFCFNKKNTFYFNKIDPGTTQDLEDKLHAKKLLQNNIEIIAQYQERLYAEKKQSLLLVLQAMDAAGKDSSIKSVMSGVNPQGISITNFKQPSHLELDHDYLWRANTALPARGIIGIFNRSYYEDVLITKVHQKTTDFKLPERCLVKDLFDKRYHQINNFEEYIHENGTRVIKVFLYISKEEQKKRFLARLDKPDKNWKFSESDLIERNYWNEYQQAYHDAINETATKDAPWYIVPANKKWFAQLVISQILVQTLKEMNPQYPCLPEHTQRRLKDYYQLLLDEDNT